MNASEKTNFIYAQLPRFVDELKQETSYVRSKYLPSIVQEIELNNERFIFVTSPARIRDENGGDKYFYPTFQNEKVLEEALTKLAVRENPKFKSEQDTLYCSLSEIVDNLYLNNAPDKLKKSIRFIQQCIRVLADVKYELIDLKSGSEQYFRLIERLESREKDGEIYYQMQFSQFFFNKTELFDYIFLPKL